MDDLDIFIREYMPVISRKKRKHRKKREHQRRKALARQRKESQRRIVPPAWHTVDECILLFINQFLQKRNPVSFRKKLTSSTVVYCQNKVRRLDVNLSYSRHDATISTKVRIIKQDPADLIQQTFFQQVQVVPEDPMMFDQIADLLDLANANYWLGDFFGTHTMQFGGVLPLAHQQMREFVPVRLIPRAGESPERLEYWKFVGTVRDGVLFWETPNESVVHQLQVDQLLHDPTHIELMITKLLDWKQAEQRRRRDKTRIRKDVRRISERDHPSQAAD